MKKDAQATNICPESNCCENDELFREYCKSRNLAVRNELLDRHMYIARIAARKFSKRGVDYEDLVQIASLALIKALDRYDCSLGYKFSTFATPTVIGELKNYFRDRASLIRLPRKESEMIASFEEAKRSLTEKYHRSPTIDEMAAHMNLPKERILEQMEARLSSLMASLDEEHQESGRNLAETLGKNEDGFNRIEDKLALQRMMDDLDEAERDLITQRYFRGQSQREVAASMDVSQMYVSRLERRILDKFRRTLVGA